MSDATGGAGQGDPERVFGVPAPHPDGAQPPEPGAAPASSSGEPLRAEGVFGSPQPASPGRQEQLVPPRPEPTRPETAPADAREGGAAAVGGTAGLRRLSSWFSVGLGVIAQVAVLIAQFFATILGLDGGPEMSDTSTVGLLAWGITAFVAPVPVVLFGVLGVLGSTQSRWTFIRSGIGIGLGIATGVGGLWIVWMAISALLLS